MFSCLLVGKIDADSDSYMKQKQVNTMNLSKATDEQLLNILRHDNSIPNDLLKLIVSEAINRDLLRGYVIYTINSYYGDTKAIEEKYNVSYQDLMQMAYMAIWRATDTFKKGKAGFINCFLTPVQRTLNQFIRDNNAQKRKGEKVSISEPVYEGLTIEQMIPAAINIERYVLSKIELEEHLNKLDKRRKKVVLMYAKGYNFPEIAEYMKCSRNYPRKLYSQAIKIMRGAV